MAVKIRLARRGRKGHAVYNVVVADARSPRDGRFVKKLGTYNPNTAPATLQLDEDSAMHYLMCGAQPTPTMRSILSAKGLMFKKHLQMGVNKGAITEKQAEERLDKWWKDKTRLIEAREKKAKQAVARKTEVAGKKTPSPKVEETASTETVDLAAKE